MESQHPPAKPLTLTQWMIVSVAALGFAFDIYELLMMPLIAGPALAELLKVPPGDPHITKWIGYIFWGSAFVGGGFGLIGGYLTDRYGRRRVLLWSILIYAFSALAAGFATSPGMLLFLRCTTFMGVCVEFVAAVAWLAELFPNPRQREQVLGYTQAFSSIGGLLVTAVAALIVKYAAGSAGHLRRACSLALHADVRRVSGVAVDLYSPVPARVAGVATEGSCRDAQTAKLCRVVRAEIAAHHDRHDDPVCLRLCARRSAPCSSRRRRSFRVAWSRQGAGESR